ncbi:hypothetical protein D3218_13115 [Aureimonas flava]|uniref:Cyanophage baseplate Pam3 plug gp18 domain-containing protein n=1 Tax=Aureimonas flava TaxID=2320271 RepID=A0A3A1WK07_9HYPH|nr:hypothetical protein [Aureimonas flava]RIY00219.1 hypothetical protein D3218_13115 [Aureimonas flava]
MREFVITDLPDQQFTVILNGRRCTIRLRYNVSADRWMMDLSIDEAPVLTGRKLVLDTDLLAPFDFGLGTIFLSDLGSGAQPDRKALPEGRVRMFHATAEEMTAARAA